MRGDHHRSKKESAGVGHGGGHHEAGQQLELAAVACGDGVVDDPLDDERGDEAEQRCGHDHDQEREDRPR